MINISRGAILIVAPGIVHASPCYADDAILYSFMIRSTTFEQVFLKQLPKISLLASFFKRALSSESRNAWLYFDTAEDPDLMDMCGKMYQLSHQPGIYNSQLMNALMTVFLITVLKKYESTARLPRTGNFFWKHEYSAILSYIQQNYAHAGIADVAEHFHYSTRQVSRVIKESLNLTYVQLIRKLRMEQAADMLLQEKYSVETIGSTVGYADTSSFCRAFAAYYKMTPGEYAAESQGQVQ